MHARNTDAGDSHRVIFGRLRARIYFYVRKEGRPAEVNYIANSLQSLSSPVFLENEGEKERSV